MMDDNQVSLKEASSTLDSPLDAPFGLQDRLQFVAELVGLAAEIKAEAQLLWRTAEGAVKVVPVAQGIGVGRGKQAAAVLADSKVSKVHFLVAPEGAEYVLTDQSSRNGTYVNGVKVTNRVLRDGDIIQVGAQVLVFLRGQE